MNLYYADRVAVIVQFIGLLQIPYRYKGFGKKKRHSKLISVGSENVHITQKGIHRLQLQPKQK